MLGARILGEFGDDPNRYADAKARKNYAGTSPITRASGARTAVLARYARNRRLGDAVHQWAFCALTTSPAPGPTTTHSGAVGPATTPPYTTPTNIGSDRRWPDATPWADSGHGMPSSLDARL